MLVPRDLPQVSTTTTDTNFKLYDSWMPYMGMQQKPFWDLFNHYQSINQSINDLPNEDATHHSFDGHKCMRLIYEINR
jgi:hypothetical protein